MLNRISIPALRAFEAAGRLNSFNSAAAELGLSASAISHAIVKLERALGVSLFERHHRLVRLTRDGQVLMQHASAAFEELRTGLELVSARRSGLLRLHCAPSFATQVLSPRLPKFLAQNPDIELKIASDTDHVRFEDGAFDANIVYGAPGAEGLTVTPLGEETVMPLCAPALAERIRTLEDLDRTTLIRSDMKRVQWADWFMLNDRRHAPNPGMSFDRSFLAIAAASNGLGVVLESTSLAQAELSSGHLVAPLAACSKPYRYVGHYLVFPRAGANRQLVQRFCAWLLAELSHDHEPTGFPRTRPSPEPGALLPEGGAGIMKL